MNQTRSLLADHYGWSWEQIKYTDSHIIRSYVKSITSKNQKFSMGNPRASAERMKQVGVL